MKILRSLFVVMLLSASNTLFAQGSDQEGLFASILNFNTWIEKLNAEYKQLIASEMKDECLRKLGYVGSDLKYIIKMKQDLLAYASKSDKSTDKLHKMVADLATPTHELIENINDMDELINDNLGVYGNQNLNKLSYDLLNEKLTMHNLMEKDLNSDNFKKFKADTEYAIALLRKADELTWSLRGKLLEGSK